ncbi:MAG TPA: VOC family protein [Mucilaginibacter sp.]|nr:VOC family protein [Mucilaginibacter sp.]
MLKLNRVHHIAIICSDYQRSKHFYIHVLGLQVVREVYRAERDSWKLDLSVNGQYQIELFSFPSPPARPSRPEAAGLRHLAFEVTDIDEAIAEIKKQGIEAEPVRTDEYTGKRFSFFADPDGLPVEFYEI